MKFPCGGLSDRGGASWPTNFISRVSRSSFFSPVSMAVIGSLILSFVAWLGAATINRDAALYMHVAELFNEQGLSVALQVFNWPWFSILLGLTSAVTGASVETAGYVWCAVFMAGTCGLLVSMVRAHLPEASYWPILVVLTIPAFNELRNDILREYGFWFFSVFSLWLYDSWRERGGFAKAAVINLAVIAAAAFRLEAVVILVALVLVQLTQIRTRSDWIKLGQLALVPAFLTWLLGFMLVVGNGSALQRAVYFFGLIDPAGLAVVINDRAQRFVDAAMSEYMGDGAVPLFMGSLLLFVVFMFAKLCGPLALVFLHRSGWVGFGVGGKRFAFLGFCIFLYIIVLLVFFIQQGFIIPRYISFLHVLAVPLLVFSVYGFASRFPRLGRVLVVILILQGLDNVISSSPGKTHYVQAGEWVGRHYDKGDSFFFQDGRIAYYAGWGYPGYAGDLDKSVGNARAGQFDYFVIDDDIDSVWLDAWLHRHSKQIIKRFENSKGDGVLIIGGQ